ncbi:MAG: hypothetical protein V2A74_10085, partial [bacterium]
GVPPATPDYDLCFIDPPSWCLMMGMENGVESLNVGQRLRVQLVRTDVERGYIDFKRVVLREFPFNIRTNPR